MVQVPDGVVEAYSDRVVNALLGFAELSSIVLGDGLGWYAALDAAGSAGLSPDELAAATGTQERYAREWLEQQAAAGFVGVVPAGPGGAGQPARRFTLPPGAAEVLLQPDSLSAVLPMVRMLRAGVAQLPDLLQAYRHGGGVGWAEIGDEAREAQFDGNRPWFEKRLGPALASAPAIHEVLSRPGARITDLGAGCGWSTLALARAYPGAAVVGIDIDGPSIEWAREHARRSGLEGRATFRIADAADPVAPASQDAVFIFEALHDMPFPVQVLASVRAMVKPDGVVVVMDEAVADAFAPDADELERLMYAYSLFICLPDSLSTPGSAGTGTVMRAPVLEGYAAAAGFSSVERLPIKGFAVFRFYRLHL
ncbi:precorrin-6B methylase 2 [Arthrobacter stackebrandtii]|uniref:Precorrin-6B methylase 2 n=1 Tax=Arthrobacter stackebrandtii TaxID=272161 RepID=A0ABS4YYU9_9MICC|nr:methyltransferase domain-containing protein [Arthrobacter stackebrandtii]MBP2413981.1 precorrin-6B methylase 2 [Arthrobacter stackebrandtii]PYG98997.1 SAM-dependent methyltransferase [Arthrobacter stackebrandtii]